MSLFKGKLTSVELAFASGEEFINESIPTYDNYLQQDNTLTKQEYEAFSENILLYRFFLTYTYLCDWCYIMQKASPNCMGGVLKGFRIAVQKHLSEEKANTFLQKLSSFTEKYHDEYLKNITDSEFNKDGFLFHGCMFISSFYPLDNINDVDKVATYTAMINNIRRSIKLLLDDPLGRFKIVE
jgi:hypothetical protein